MKANSEHKVKIYKTQKFQTINRKNLRKLILF